jgi:hypothetical protein
VAAEVGTSSCYTVNELARRWRRRPSAIRKMIRMRQLVAFSFAPGGPLRIAPEEVARFEAGHQVEPVKPMRSRQRKPADWQDYY